MVTFDTNKICKLYDILNKKYEELDDFTDWERFLEKNQIRVISREYLGELVHDLSEIINNRENVVVVDDPCADSDMSREYNVRLCIPVDLAEKIIILGDVPK